MEQWGLGGISPLGKPRQDLRNHVYRIANGFDRRPGLGVTRTLCVRRLIIQWTKRLAPGNEHRNRNQACESRHVLHI